MSDIREAAPLVPSERWVQSVLQNITDTVSIADATGTLTYTSGSHADLLGYPEHFWERQQPMGLVHPDDLDRAMAGWQRAIDHPGVEVAEEVRMRAADGSWQDIAVSAMNLLADPEVRGFLMTTRNITALRRAERLASHQAAVLELIATGEPLGAVAYACIELLDDNAYTGRFAIYLLDGQSLVLRAGDAPPAVAEWMAVPDRHPGRSVCDAAMAVREPVVVDDLRAAELPEGLRAVAEAEGIAAAWSLPIVSVATETPVGSLSTLHDRSHIPTDHERRVAEVAASLMAIAIERVETESHLAHQALHDALTGLPNRTLLLDRLEHALARGRAGTSSQVGLLFCDIDRFKVINDSLGHTVGDELLIALADRLRAALAPGDTIARLGGDEFVVLIEDVVDDAQPAAAADAIAEAVRMPFALASGHEVDLTLSIGLAVAGSERPAEAWLRDADAAMYRAKELGRNRLVLFDTAMREAAVARLEVEHDLRRAVEREQLEVHYQPVVDLRAGRIIGAEALVRWRHPTRGLLSPDEFIEIAEEVGTIGELGQHVLDVAVGSIADLVAPTPARPFQLGVNVSGRQLAAGDLAADVRRVLADHGWPASSLLLEITESALVSPDTEALAQLRSLRDLGLQLAIDDFGTGWSSLARLGQLPVDQVKVDRTFVAALGEPDDRMARMVDAVLGIASALEHQTCAEGVETQAQLDALRRKRCDYAQGYLFARPMPLEEFASLHAADPRW